MHAPTAPNGQSAPEISAAPLNLQGLFSIAAPMKETLLEAEQILNALEYETGMDVSPSQALHKLYEAAQVCEFMQLRALAHLAMELAYGFEKIIYEKDFDGIEDLRPALIEGFVIFNRYLEFVLLQGKTLDSVLLTTINRLRSLRKLPALFGTEFLIENEQARQQVVSVTAPLLGRVLDNETIIASLTALHRPYRMQLFKLLNAAAYTVQWQKALETLTATITDILAAARGSCQEQVWGYLLQAVSASTSEQQTDLMLACLYPALMRAERLLAHPREKMEPHLLADSLSLALLRNSPQATQLRKTCALDKILPTHKTLERLKLAFFGPTSGTATHVGDLLLAETEAIKNEIVASRDAENMSLERLRNLINQLTMLKLDGSARDLEGFIQKYQLTADTQVRAILGNRIMQGELIEQLHRVENSVMLYQMSYTPGTTILPLHNFKISIRTLDSGRNTLIQESMKLLAVVRDNIITIHHALTSPLPGQPVDSFSLMQDVVNLLEQLGGVMAFLFVENGYRLAHHWSRLLGDHLQAGKPLTSRLLYNLATGVIPLEMYFEHLQEKRPPRLEWIEQALSVFENSPAIAA